MSAAILFVAAALLAFGDGPTMEKPRVSKADYEQKVRTVYHDVQSAFLATRTNSGGDDLARKIAAAQRALRHAANELAAINPPAEVDAHNRALVDGMLEYASALDAAVDAARRNDSARVSSFQDASTHAAVRKMRTAAKKMKHLGYNLGPIAGGS